MEFVLKILPFIPMVLGAIVVCIIIAAGYLKAPPDVAYVISGIRKKPRILIGQAGIRVPFFERVDRLALGAIQIDVKTKSAVPTVEYINVKVDSTVSIKVGQSEDMIILASQNFLNTTRDTIAAKINDLLEGNIREIVGTMTLKDMVSDRKGFSSKVQENVVPDLARFGLELISFNVQNFIDDNGVIENLGIDNVAQISKNAAIAKSNAEKEVAIAKSTNEKESNEARVRAAKEIAEQEADLIKRKADLKRDTDIQVAQAEAAKGIEAENQRKLKDVAATNADIATAEREADLKKKQIELKEYELDALVRKQADADKYAAEKKAEADQIRRQKDAEARAYEIEQQARAQKAKADADKYSAEQQAASIAMVGKAEADAIAQKAEAQRKMGEASVLEMYFKILPQVMASAAAPLEKIDNITIYGADGSTQLVESVMRNADQVMKGLTDATGIDIKSTLAAIVANKVTQK